MEQKRRPGGSSAGSERSYEGKSYPKILAWFLTSLGTSGRPTTPHVLRGGLEDCIQVWPDHAPWWKSHNSDKSVSHTSDHDRASSEHFTAVNKKDEEISNKAEFKKNSLYRYIGDYWLENCERRMQDK